MLQNITNLKGFTVRAADGGLGTVEQLYFDDENWTIRYLAVDTGGWLGGRKIIISPFSISHVNWELRSVDVSLTRANVQASPYIYTHQPISRQHEAAFLSHFGYPNYWGGAHLWGTVASPSGFVAAAIDSAEAADERTKAEPKDSHLRSTGAVRGYDVQGADGEIGHVCGFVLDDDTWTLRYIEVATRHWWPGKKVLVSPKWIQRVSWLSSKIHIALSRKAIQTAPEHLETVRITREFETRLYLHYALTPYWENGAEVTGELALAGST